MAHSFRLTVAKVGETLFEGEAFSAIVPGSDGVFEILAGHEALVSPLTSGEIHIQAADGTAHHFEVPHSGIAEISNNQATLLL